MAGVASRGSGEAMGWSSVGVVSRVRGGSFSSSSAEGRADSSTSTSGRQSVAAEGMP